jgi:membrane fusion protein (multidrug efflux system)
MSGLQGGDRVVVDGALRVVPGQPVKVVEPAAEKTAPAAKK